MEHRLLWGPNVDQILADETDSGDVNWALTDHLNTVRDWAQYNDATDTTSIVNHIAYDAYGNILSETTPSLDAIDLYYTARYFDDATGLQYNTNRWYDPATGKWISQDPIGFGGGDANLYRYVGNEPTNATDPSGLEESKKKGVLPRDRTPEQEVARGKIDYWLEQYRRHFGIDEHALLLLNMWLDGDGSPWNLDDRYPVPNSDPLCTLSRFAGPDVINRIKSHEAMKEAIRKIIESDIANIVAAGSGTEFTVAHPSGLFVFPENAYGPDSLFGYLHGGGLSGSIAYTVTPLKDGSLVISYSGHFAYKDAIDMNAAAGDEFFCRWTDPMGGGHDYDFSATWGITGQVQVMSNGTMRGKVGYPYNGPKYPAPVGSGRR